MSITKYLLDHLLIFLCFAGLVPLGVAYYFELAHNLDPCQLCIYQRVPYGLAIILGLLGTVRKSISVWCVLIIGLAFLFNTFLAVYHVGIEQYWWGSSIGCQSGLIERVSVSEFKTLLSNKMPSACDVVQWSVFGISMAGFNILFSFCLSVICFFGFLDLRNMIK